MADLPRSMLFVSGERPDRFAKAFATGADLVCIDLEDAVPADAKSAARAAALAFARQPRPSGGPQLALRTNGVATREGLLDLQALADAGIALDYLLLPKIECARDLALVHAWAPHAFGALVALVETPLGIENAHAIGAAVAGGAPRLAALMLGGADLAVELQAVFEWDSLLGARARLLNAARASGLQAWDVPFIDIGDMDGLAAETRAVLRMGFGCKTAIHPTQIAAIHAAFEPSAEQVRWARAVVQAAAARDAVQTPGAFLHDGRMIDAPVLRAAERIVGLADRAAAGSPASQQQSAHPS